MASKPTQLPALTDLNSLREALDVRLGRRGDPMDRALTVRDLVDGKLPIKAVRRYGPGQFGVEWEPTPDKYVPPAPTGLVALPQFGGISVWWDEPPKAWLVSYAEIYRATADDLDNRQFLTASGGGTIFDLIDEEDSREYAYWVRFVSISGHASAYAGPVKATATPLVSDTMQRLTEQIDESLFVKHLQDKIDLIVNDEAGSVNARLLQERTARLEDIDSLDSKIDLNKSVLRREITTAVKDAKEEAEVRSDKVRFDLENALARTEQVMREGDQALSERVDTVTAATDKAFADLAKESQARVDGDEAVTRAYEAAVAKNRADAEAAVVAERQARVSADEAMAQDIRIVESRIDDNVAGISRVDQALTSQVSALAASISSLTARLDATPVWVSSFETDADFDRWHPGGKGTVTRYGDDGFGSPTSALMTYENNPSHTPSTSGYFPVEGRISESQAANFAGKRVRVTGYARAPDTNAASEFAVCYSTNGRGDSPWHRFPVESDWTLFEFLYDVPPTDFENYAAVRIWADTSSTGKGVLFDLITVQPATTEEDLPAITAAIEQEAAARVDADSALTEQINTAKSTLGDAVAGVRTQLNTEVSRLDDGLLAAASARDDLRSELGNSLAGVSSRVTTEVQRLDDAITATSGKVDQVQSALGQDIANVSSTVTTEVQRLDDAITAQSDKTDEVKAELEQGLSGVRNTISSEVQSLGGRITALANQTSTQISELDDAVSAQETRITNEVTRLDNKTTATAQNVTTLQTNVGKDIALLEQTLRTEIEKVGDDAASAQAIWSVRVLSNGLAAGFVLGSNGQTAMAGFDVDRFFLGRSTDDMVRPFIMDNGTIYIDTAMIRDGSIQEGQIGPITVGKLTGPDGSPVTTAAGKFRADSIDASNLDVRSAATFSGDVFSRNYQSGVRGWVIRQSGYVEFNEAMIRGNLEVQSLTVNGKAPFGGFAISPPDRSGSDEAYRSDSSCSYYWSSDKSGSISKMPKGSRIRITVYPRVTGTASWQGYRRRREKRIGASDDSGVQYVWRTYESRGSYEIKTRVRVWVDGSQRFDKTHYHARGSYNGTNSRSSSSFPNSTNGYNFEYTYPSYRSTSTIRILVQQWANGSHSDRFSGCNLKISGGFSGHNALTADIYRLG